MTLSHQDVRNILSILDGAEHLESIDLKMGDFHLQAFKPGALRQQVAAAEELVPPSIAGASSPQVSAGPAVATGPVVQATSSETTAGMVPVCAPMVGTFYARPSPDQPPFVSVGSKVQAHDTVGLVEVMKMFNSIKAGVAGTVQHVVAESGKPVQPGQTLLLIEPSLQA